MIYADIFQGMQLAQAEQWSVDYCDSLKSVCFEDIPCTEQRIQLVTNITEGFYAVFEQFPSQYILNKLSDYLLLDYIKSPNKKKTDEIQFHSPTQTKARNQKEFALNGALLDHFNAKRVWNLPQKRTTSEQGDV